MKEQARPGDLLSIERAAARNRGKNGEFCLASNLVDVLVFYLCECAVDSEGG